MNKLLKPFLLAGVLLYSAIVSSQKIDSVRQVIRSMGYDLPRLSPLPESPGNKNEDIIGLNGTWQFAAKAGDTATRDIDVPGEWVMQGFKVNPGTFAEYRRNFNIPSGWHNRRIKLRCDAVYSECEIFINGVSTGSHLGGFTAFEIDITGQVRPGKDNSISIKVRSESIADSLASGSQYATHPLGGISRKIYLVALPEINFSMFHVSASFDSNYRNATLKAEVELSNESDKDAGMEFTFELRKTVDQTLVLTKEIKSADQVKAHNILYRVISFNVENPQKWDPEHPNLYNLTLRLVSKGKTVETVTRTFGFRQIEVRGNQVFVNNMPVKLRGVCRHEVMPLRGRSLDHGQWEEDVRLFREANVNYIRTSHYPPAPEFVEACDRLGIFVEVEGPFCWAANTKVPANLRYTALIQPEIEMVNTFRSNPSVLMWSIANESEKYKEYFSYSASIIRAIDPTRPRNYSHGNPDIDNGELEVCTDHYPGPAGPAKYAGFKRPVTFDEYCHLNAYNRFELVTDPGLRDAWGLGFMWMWEKMYSSGGVLGGAIWAGIDDSFFLPGGIVVGYGTWGPLDGWRRLKPEYWHIKKVYSPVRVKQAGNRDAITGTLKLEIENRLLFSGLNECHFIWTSGPNSGTFTADARPGETTTVLLKVPATQKVRVDVMDPRGILIDQYEFIVVPSMAKLPEIKTSPLEMSETATEKRIKSSNLVMVIDKVTRSMKEVQSDGKTVLRGDALIMVLPLNGNGNGTQMTGDTARFDPFTATCANRSVSRIEQLPDGDGFILRISDRSDEASGYTEYRIADGALTVSYHYEILKNINPRQVGLVFTLPGTFQQLEWDRRGQWNYYPDDHIGRLNGFARAHNDNPLSGPAGPVTKPSMDWAYDQNKLGTNDFRSTKMNILWASVTNGTEKVSVNSDGSQSIRCWLENGTTRMLVAGYSNMGSERFFRSHAEQVDKPLKPGDIISGVVNLLFTGRPGDADYPQAVVNKRHDEKVAAIKDGHYNLFLIGNSITQNLEGLDNPENADQQSVWNKYLRPLNAIDLGYSGYRTENILWNLQNGELDQQTSPEAVMLLIGTNNLDDQHYETIHTAEQVFAGTKAIVDLIRQRHPTTKILVLRTFICGGPDDKTTFYRSYNRSAKAMEATLKAGELTRQLADDVHVFWLDINHVFLRTDGTINTDLMPDLIHPNAAGAEAWMQAVLPTLKKMMSK